MLYKSRTRRACESGSTQQTDEHILHVSKVGRTDRQTVGDASVSNAALSQRSGPASCLLLGSTKFREDG